jgi:streptogramin lyase
VWFTETNAGQVGRITSIGTITEFTLPTPDSGPWSIAAGPDGALWFTEASANGVGRIGTNGMATEFALNPGATARSIAAGPDGNLWFTESDAVIGRITPAGTITIFSPPSQFQSASGPYVVPPIVWVSGPDGITAGPDGKLWFTNHYGVGEPNSYAVGAVTTSGIIGTFDYPNFGIGPNGSILPAQGNASAIETFVSGSGITAGPDGALWCTVQANLGLIARVTTGTNLSDWSDPELYQASAYWIVTGPDGALWFTMTYQQNAATPTVSAIGRAVLMSVTPAALPAANVGAAYSQSLAVTGAIAPYTWSATGMPPGLSLSSDGTLTGTPTAAGSYTPQMLVQDSSTPPVTVGVNYTLDSEQLAIEPAVLPPFVGSPDAVIDQQFNVSGGTPPYSWTLVNAPDSFYANSLVIKALDQTEDSIKLQGNLREAGVFPMIIIVTDSSTSHLSASRALMLNVMEGGGGLNYVYPTGGTDPVATFYMEASVPYNAILQPLGGTPPYTWSATGLPGSMLITADGVLSGAPQSPGTYLWTLTLQDSSTPPLVSNSILSFIASAPVLTITTTELPQAFLGSNYATALVATGGTPPYQWTATGLPAGMTLSGGGILSGAPIAVFNAGITGFVNVTVTDSSTPAQSATQKYDLVVAPTVAAVITTTLLPPGVVGVSYDQPVYATNIQDTLTIIAGDLPDGLNLDSTTMTISGMPSKAGVFEFTLQAEDTLNRTATLELTIVISGPGFPVITTTYVPDSYCGVNYSATLSAIGGTPPYKWTASFPPDGLTLSTSGVVSGKPLGCSGGEGGAMLVAVQDSSTPPLSNTASVSYDVFAAPSAFSITTTSLPDGTVGTYYSTQLAATGGAPPYSWSLEPVSTLPYGLTLNALSGVISGTATEEGVFSDVFIDATDSLNNVARSQWNGELALVIHGAAATGALNRAGVFSQVASGAGWKTSLYLINRTSAASEFRVNFWADDGTPLIMPLTVTGNGAVQTLNTARVTGSAGPNSTILIESQPPAHRTTREGDSTMVPESACPPAICRKFPPDLTGWAEVLSSNTVSGYGVLDYTSPVGVQSEGAIPLDTTTSSALLLPYESSNGFGASVALADLSQNYGAQNTTIVWDENGNNLSDTVINLAANGRASFTLDDLAPLAAGHRGYVQFTSTAGQGLAGPGIAGLGWRANPAGGLAPVMPLDVSDAYLWSGDASFTHVVAGAGWTTSLYLVNALDYADGPPGPGAAFVYFYGDDGTALTLPLTVTQNGSVETLNSATVTASVGTNSTVLIEIASPSPTPVTGWARVQLDDPMAGYGVIHYDSPAGTQSDAALPLEFNRGASFVLPYDCTNELAMNIALTASISGLLTTVPVAVTAVDENGVALPGATINLPEGGHTSFTLTDVIPAATGHRGFLEFTATPVSFSSLYPSVSVSITGIGLRVSPSAGIATVPKLQ